MAKYRTAAGRAFKIPAGSHVHVTVEPSRITVTRGNGGAANELLEAAVKSSLQYTAGGSLRLVSDTLKATGGVFHLKG